MTDASGVPATARERGRIAPVRFAHIVLKTSRFEEMLKWYQTVLEAEVAMSNGILSFLTYDDEHHRVALANFPGLEDKAPAANGIEHFAYTYETLDDLIHTYERLKGEGIEPYWCINHGPTLSFYYRDPDANQVELQIDIYDTIEETNAWFEQSDFETNPIGVKFEPDDIIARFRAGEARETLLARAVIDPAKVGEQFPSS